MTGAGQAALNQAIRCLRQVVNRVREADGSAINLRVMMTAHAAVEIPQGLLLVLGMPQLLFRPGGVKGADFGANNAALVLCMRWLGCAVLMGGFTAFAMRDFIPRKTHDLVIYGIAMYHALITAISLSQRYDFGDWFVPALVPFAHGALALGFVSVAALGPSGRPLTSTFSVSSMTTVIHNRAPQNPDRPRVSYDTRGELDRAIDAFDPFAEQSDSSESDVEHGGHAYPVETPEKDELPQGRLVSCLSEEVRSPERAQHRSSSVRRRGVDS
eukprot:TRINITY_DN16619_c0_g1_i1.p1 TRINITY_DN16619_c0_g1~~TRINITY_DN16619_c0_g1_i1.p1  ORF type:complete len:271 (+),score=80.06 TRINITY_DN16619_c0_g1_i1:73-885(+)